MLGFRGHWSTKSRRYSTTSTVVRRARVAFVKRRRAKDGVPLDAWGRPEDDQAVVVVASRVFVGSGYGTEGERWLALSDYRSTGADAAQSLRWLTAGVRCEPLCGARSGHG
jgi:hypothetical protein